MRDACVDSATYWFFLVPITGIWLTSNLLFYIAGKLLLRHCRGGTSRTCCLHRWTCWEGYQRGVHAAIHRTEQGLAYLNGRLLACLRVVCSSYDSLCAAELIDDVRRGTVTVLDLWHRHHELCCAIRRADYLYVIT